MLDTCAIAASRAVSRRLAPDQRREAIVDAALAVARRQGLGATTVRDVAAEMGTSSGLIHHYFDSMDDVLAAAFERVAGEDLDRPSERVAEARRPRRRRPGVLRDLRARRCRPGVPAVAGRVVGGASPARPSRRCRAG